MLPIIKLLLAHCKKWNSSLFWSFYSIYVRKTRNEEEDDAFIQPWNILYNLVKINHIKVYFVITLNEKTNYIKMKIYPL